MGHRFGRTILLGALACGLAQATRAQESRPYPASPPGAYPTILAPSQGIGEFAARVAAQPSPGFGVSEAPAGVLDGGFSAYVLTAYWSGGHVAFYNTAPRAPSAPTVFVSTSFPAPVQAAPAAWIGYVHASGYGLRANYFFFNQFWNTSTSSTATVDVTDATGNLTTTGAGAGTFAFVFTSMVKLNSWDLEATKTLRNQDWTCTAAAGLRYLSLQQTYSSETTPGAASLVQTRNIFDGLGPTAACSGRRRFAASGFGLYGEARGALLFGTQVQNMSSNGGAVVSEAFKSSLAQTANMTVMPVAQLELGIDYRWPLLGGAATLRLENGMVGQAWFHAGTPSNTSTDPFLPISGAANASTSTLGLFGLRSSLGLTY